MAATMWIFLAILTLMVVTIQAAGDEETIKVEKREMDPEFYRRYNRLRRVYGHNPFAFDFFKYFLRNRGQRRERRQVSNNFPSSNGGGFNGGYLTYDPNQQAPTPQRAKDTKRETTRRRKPFRPAMLFF